MGCGISTLAAEDASLSRQSNRQRQRAIVPPVTDNNFGTLPNNGNEGAALENKEMKPILGDEEAKTMEAMGSNNDNVEKLREKCVDNKKVEEERVFEGRGKEKHDNKHAKNVMNVTCDEEHEENKDRDDSIIAPGSPSFRAYCVDSDSVDRSSVGDSNYCSDDDSTSMKTKPKIEGSVNCNKEPEQKERRGRGFRNVMNKGKARGRRNLLNFGCYNASSESYAESSFNKMEKLHEK